jgi:hypothetical protein
MGPSFASYAMQQEHRRRQQQKEYLTTAGMPTMVETPTTVKASAGTLTATEMSETLWTPTTHEISQKFAKKTHQNI